MANTPKNDKREQGGTHPYLDASTAYEAFHQSEQWIRPYDDPIQEFERLARNKPSEKIPSHLPRVTDGTMSAIIQDTPKRAIQQGATGKITSISDPEYAVLADYANRYLIQPRYVRQGNALQKHWNMMSKAMTWGSAASYTFMTTDNGILHSDFIIPYVKDVITEKGKVYAPDSNYMFLRTWFQKTDIQAIIRREKWLTGQDKNYQSGWNLDLLAKLLDAPQQTKRAELQTAAEREKGGGSTSGYEMIHVFQDGIGAEFYTFSPNFAENAVLRVKVNPDPRGKIPLDFEYANIDLTNPRGRGAVEASGGVQNLIDQQMQLFQFMSTLEMAPPTKKWGNVKSSTIQYRSNALWDMNGPKTAGNDVEVVQVNTTAMGNFSNNYGLLKSQILNLNSAQDNSVSGEATGGGQSKTQAGVKASESRLGVSDNYLRLQHETWLSAQTATSVNLTFAESEKDQTITLPKEDARELALHHPEVAESYLKEDVLTIPFGKINDVSFTFVVDANSSEIKEDADNAEKLQETYALMVKDPDPAVQKAKLKVLKSLVNEIGAQGTDDIFPEDEQGESSDMQQGMDPNAMMQQLMPQVQQMIEQAVEQAKIKPQEYPTLALIKALGLKFDELPEGARQIVLEHTGLNTGEPTPGTEDRAHNQGMAIDAQAHKQALDAHNVGTSATQTEQSNAQSQAQFEAGQQDKAADRQMQAQQANQSPDNEQAETQQESPELEQAEQGLSEDELQIVHALIQQGFNDDDVEQAITLMRAGRDPQEVIQVLGAKYAQQ